MFCDNRNKNSTQFSWDQKLWRWKPSQEVDLCCPFERWKILSPRGQGSSCSRHFQQSTELAALPSTVHQDMKTNNLLSLISTFTRLARERKPSSHSRRYISHREFLITTSSPTHHLFSPPASWCSTPDHLFSFSKSYCLPGQRVGATITSQPLLNIS